MPTTLRGTVRGGVIVPDAPLPDGTSVEIRVLPLEMPLEWQEEFEAWNRASDKALNLTEEQLPDEEQSGETR